MHSHLILIVEEDRITRSFLADQLVADGYCILIAENRPNALHLLAEHRPQLVLADINGQTLGLLDAIRNSDALASKIDPNTPMIILTARAHELDRVRVFDHAGDDVLAKPFSYPELRGRIRALLRRVHEPKLTPVSQVGALTVDHRARDVRVNGQQVQLAAKEFELLQALIAEPTRVFTRRELLHEVWGYTTPSSRTVDSHAARLRKKIATREQPLVIAIWGVGLPPHEPRTDPMTEMRDRHHRSNPTSQPTCRRWPSPTNTANPVRPLEISHAVRLRQKLVAAGAGRRLVINVWSIGYRLIDGELHQAEGASR